MLESSDESIENYAVRANGEIVGFFRLDFDRHRVAQYAGDGHYCGLRGYLIGRGHQGNGYGRAAIPAIARPMRDQHPEIERLVLTVNLRNAAAISTYLKAGFHDTGAVYHGGNSGPQHVFSMPPAERRPDPGPGSTDHRPCPTSAEPPRRRAQRS